MRVDVLVLDLLNGLNAVLARQTEVEQHQLVDVFGQSQFSGNAVMYPVDRVSFLLQTVLHTDTDHWIIFDKQQAQRGLHSNIQNRRRCYPGSPSADEAYHSLTRSFHPSWT